MSGTAAALGGIRVLDLSTGVAGQYCGKLLAGYGADCVLAEPPEGTPTRRMGPYLSSGRSSTRSAVFRHLNQGKSSLAHLGAEVIKIDAPSHTDSWRGAPEGGAARHYPDGDPGKHPWNRCVLFNTQGQGKLSLGLDLKVAGAREILLRLAEASDVLIANFTPGVLDRLGIGYDALSARNTRIVVVEMPAFGPGGPDSDHQGMGKTMEAACGMAALMGYGEGPPVLTGPAYLDPIGGLSAVGATLVALRHRDETGTGCRVEVPQTEAGAHWIGEHVLLQAETGIRAETIAELQRAGAIAGRPLRAQFTTTAAAFGNRPPANTASSPDGPRAHAPDQQRIPMISTTFDYDTIEITVDHAVATITLNRPDQLNAWDWQMHRELRTAYAALDASDDVRVIILTGAGRAFCAGAALAPKGETFDGSRDPAAWNERYPGPALDAPELMTPVIAAINGAAVGAGITMAVSCDIRIAAENAKIGFVFNRRGVVPDADLLWSLPRMIGYARAMDLLLTGRIFTGKEAAEIGLVSRAVPQENVLAVATEMARDIAENVAPASAAITKQVARQFLEETDRKAALERERILFRWAGQQPDAREGVEAFLQRRPAQWRLSKHATLPPEATVGR